MEKERDEAKQEAKVALVVASATGDAKARAEEDLAKVQEALAAVEEGRRKAEVETTRLEVEQKTLLLELGATKDEVSSLHSQVGRDKEAMEDVIPSTNKISKYGYHNISILFILTKYV